MIASHNAPGNNWRNTVERVMLVLNLRHRGTGVRREESSAEHKIKRYNTILIPHCYSKGSRGQQDLSVYDCKRAMDFGHFGLTKSNAICFP